MFFIMTKYYRSKPSHRGGGGGREGGREDSSQAYRAELKVE